MGSPGAAPGDPTPSSAEIPPHDLLQGGWSGQLPVLAKNFPVCKSALDGMGSPAGRGGGSSPPLTSCRLQEAFVCGCAAQNWVLRAKACSLSARCTSNAQPVSCPNLQPQPAGKRTRTRASGQRGVSHPLQSLADARHRMVHRNGSGQGVRRIFRTARPWLSAGPGAFCAGLRWHTGGWS